MEANTKRPRLALHRALLMGSGGVGKTSLCNSFCFGHYIDTFDSSIDDGYRKEIIVEDKPYMIHIFDKAGQAEHLALRQKWIRESSVIVLVFSFLSRESFEKTKKLYQQIHSVKKTPIPLILAGNKCDIGPEFWQISAEEARDLAKEFDCEIVQTSAKYDENVEELFHKLISLAHHLDDESREQTNGSQNWPSAVSGEARSIESKGPPSERTRDHNIRETALETRNEVIDATVSPPHTTHAVEATDRPMPERELGARNNWRRRFSGFLRRF